MMMMYNRVLGRQLSKAQVDINNFDLTENMPDLPKYDPSVHLRDLNKEFRSFPPEIQDRIRSASFVELRTLEGIGDFGLKLEKLMTVILSDNGNDFSATPLEETPELVVKMVVDFRDAEG